MSKTWRPEGWKNPYHGITVMEGCKATGEIRTGGFIASTEQQEAAAFEAGADAMLKALAELLAALEEKGDLGWDDLVVRDQGIARIGFVRTLPNGRPMIMHWSFDSTEYGREEGVSYTARDLQRISEAYWKGKRLPKLTLIKQSLMEREE